MTTSVDPSAAGLLSARFLEWIGEVDLLLPNADEAAVLSGVDDPAAAARALTATGREVVVTLGAEGALWSDSERVAHAPAAPLAAPVRDTTGAGDAFAAGLLSVWRAGADPAAALAAGCRLAAQAVARSGAR